MAIDVTSLPRDVDELIGIIADLGDENDRLQAMLDTLQRTLFGTRSERRETDAAQLTLGIEDTSAAPVEPERATAKPVPRDHPSRPAAARNIGQASSARRGRHRACDRRLSPLPGQAALYR
jgi:hypothetical protein